MRRRGRLRDASGLTGFVFRRAFILLLCVCLAACGGNKTKKPNPPEPEKRLHNKGRVPDLRRDQPGDYTAGGLYKPGVADSGPAIPPDISALKEPVPRDEPLAKYGNRSPYTVLGKSYHVMKSAKGYVERGIASWYGEKFHGRATSSMEAYDMYQFSAAHKTLPLPAYARVTNLENGRSIVVKVNDRGPFHENRLIDLSYAAAIKLGMHVQGTAKVEVRALQPGDKAIPVAPKMEPIVQVKPPMKAEPAPPPTAPTLPAKTEPAKPAAPEAPVASAPAANAPVAAPKTGRFWLQAGSFGEQGNAQRLVQKLQAATLAHVDVQQAQANGRTVYRVRVGPFDSREAAQPAAQKILDEGLGNPTFVAD